VAHRLGLNLVPVLPAALAPVPGPLYGDLLCYKESSVGEERQRAVGHLARLLRDFLAHHGRCLEATLGGPAQVALAVPSTSRPGPASLERLGQLDGLVPAALGTPLVWGVDLLWRTEAPILAFAVPDANQVQVRGRRVLVLDDSYVSGARSQSAAAALRMAGARAVVILPLGRVLRPDRVAAHAEFLQQVGAPSVRCARCLGNQAEAGTG
jgi:hypothetical protein